MQRRVSLCIDKAPRLEIQAIERVTHSSAQDFVEREGTLRPDGSRDTPALQKFEVQISKYRAIEEEVQMQPSSVAVKYLRMDTRPLKQALVAWITKWIFLYTQCLQDKVTHLLLGSRVQMAH